MSHEILSPIFQDSMGIDSKNGNAFSSHVNLNPNVFFQIGLNMSLRCHMSPMKCNTFPYKLKNVC